MFKLRLQNNLTKDLAAFNRFVRARRIRQWKHPVDDGFELASEHTTHHFQKLCRTAHRRADNLHLPIEDVAQICFRRISAGGSTRENAAAFAGRTKAADPRIRPDAVDDNINAPAAREFADLSVEFFLRIVDEEIRAELPGLFQLCVRAGCGEDTAAGKPGDLDGGSCHAPAGAQNQHVLAGPQLSFTDQHAPCRQKREGDGGRVFEGQRIRNGQHDVSRNGHKLCIGAAAVFTDHRKRLALASITGTAGLTPAAGDGRIDDDPLAWGKPTDIFTHRANSAGRVTARNHRKSEVNSREASAYPEIDVIDGCGADFQEYLIRGGAWIRRVLVSKCRGPSVLVNDDGFHGMSIMADSEEIPGRAPHSVNENPDFFEVLADGMRGSSRNFHLSTMDISGKVALITGSSKRIGRETAIELARRGGRVAIHYRSDEAGAQETLKLVRQAGGSGELFHAELTSPQDIEKMFGGLEAQLGGLDILVNNASVFDPCSVDEATVNDWDTQMDSNARAPFFVAQAAARLMRKRGHGKIVNLVDGAGELIWPGYFPYSVSKAALIAVNRGLAKALAPEIQVNGIAPGPVLFPEYYSDDQKHLAIERTLLKRAGSAKDIVNAVIFLIENDYITGEIIHVDGGRHIQ